MTNPEPTPAPETQPPATGDAPPQQPPAEQPPADPKTAPTDSVEFWKAQARKNEATAKAHAKKLQDIEDANLSELDRFKKSAAEAEQRYSELQRQNTLLAKGIPGDLTPPSPSASTDDWAGYADRLLAWRGQIPTPPAPVPVPKPDQSQGPRPGTPETDDEAFYAKFYPTPKS